jgi:hypothetical protein
MDPQLEKSPGLALPQPSVEGSAGFNPNQLPGHMRPEAMPAAPEMASQPAAPAFAAPAAAPLSPTLPSPQPIAAPAAPLPVASSDDNDELDQEWINKAKAIVEHTKNDPYVESREISKAKADYLRTRYNKHIKVAEERAQ